MRIFIDIGHPAHLHYIRPFYQLMHAKGHDFFISARNKECSHALLHHYGIPFYNRGKGGKGFVSKLLYLFVTDIRLWLQALRFKPDIFLGFSSPYLAHVSFLCRKPYWVCDDTEKNRLTQLLYRPFARHIITPDCYEGEVGRKQMMVPSYFELFYLHPRFFTPDEKVWESLGLIPGTPYAILRFVSFHASHDIGHAGISTENKQKIVRLLEEHVRVFISSEAPLPAELKPYEIPIKPWEMHDALYYASLLFGESATMASEAACLGTPAIYINDDGRGYTRDEEIRYGLVHNFTESPSAQQAAMEKAMEIIKNKSSKVEAQKSQKRLLREKTDITEFLIERILSFN